MEISPEDGHKLINALDQIMEFLETIVKDDLKKDWNTLPSQNSSDVTICKSNSSIVHQK